MKRGFQYIKALGVFVSTPYPWYPRDGEVMCASCLTTWTVITVKPVDYTAPYFHCPNGCNVPPNWKPEDYRSTLACPDCGGIVVAAEDHSGHRVMLCTACDSIVRKRRRA